MLSIAAVCLITTLFDSLAAPTIAMSSSASSEASAEEGERRWLPLESNPDVLNPFVARLGCPDAWGFTDVFGKFMQAQSELARQRLQ